MSRRETIHELAEVLATVCHQDTIAEIIDATLSVDDDERLSDYEVQLANALFESLCELRPDCVTIAQHGGEQPKRSWMQWILGI